MSHYLMLLKMRELSIICKAKKYLKAGQKPPSCVKLHKGPRGGTYYNTEDVKDKKGAKKKEAPKTEEPGEKKKRLPAFRKQEDGSVMHRTKEGEHGPGAYKIRTEGKEHQLSFLKPSGEELHLGKHADIKELKRMVSGFKGGEKEAPKEEEKIDTYNTHATIVVKNPNTDHERHEIYTTGDEGEMKHRVNQLNNQEGRRAYILSLPKGKKTGDILDDSDMKPREYSDIEKEAMAHPEYENVQEKQEFIRGWKEAREAVSSDNTPEDVLQGISSDTSWGGDNDYLHGARVAMRQMLDTQEEEGEPDTLPAPVTPKKKTRIDKGAALMTPEAAYDRKQFIADHLVFRTATKSAREKNGLVDQVMKHKTRPGWYTLKYSNGAEKDFDSADSLYEWTRRSDLGSLIRRIEEDRSDILTSDAGKEYIRKVERDIVWGNQDQKTKPSVPSSSDDPIKSAIDKRLESNKKNNIDRLVFARSGDTYLTSTGETIPADKLPQNATRIALATGKDIDVLEQVNKNGDLGHVRTINMNKPSAPSPQREPSSPLSSGDTRHNPEQKKIASGLGETKRQTAKETVKEFGVDTRSMKKETGNKRSRQDRLSQVRISDPGEEPPKNPINDSGTGKEALNDLYNQEAEYYKSGDYKRSAEARVKIQKILKERGYKL